jgi:hypothetical protein
VTTTALFVELIVIGVGGVAWASLAVLSVFGYSWLTFDRATSLTSLVPLLSLTYVFGIVVDRMADQIFRRPSRLLLHRWFTSFEQYQKAKTLVYVESPLRNLIEYNRSRLRICRGWAFNCALLLATFNTFVWYSLPSGAPRMKLALVGSAMILAFGMAVSNAWYQLSKVAFERLAEQAALLSNNSIGSGSTPRDHSNR